MNIIKPSDIDKMLTIIASDVETDSNSEYDELMHDIKLIIHEFIDKYDAICKNAVYELIDDITTRDGIEEAGHDLNPDEVNRRLVDLIKTFYDIYTNENGTPRGIPDIFKYALAYGMFELIQNREEYDDVFDVPKPSEKADENTETKEDNF